MKLSRLLLPAIGLIACVCAVSVAASLSDTPITVSPQVLEKLAELPAPPSQMLGESTNSEIPQPPTRGQSSIQSQRLDLSSLPTQSNRSIAPAPVPYAAPVTSNYQQDKLHQRYHSIHFPTQAQPVLDVQPQPLQPARRVRPFSKTLNQTLFSRTTFNRRSPHRFSPAMKPQRQSPTQTTACNSNHRQHPAV